MSIHPSICFHMNMERQNYIYNYIMHVTTNPILYIYIYCKYTHIHIIHISGICSPSPARFSQRRSHPAAAPLLLPRPCRPKEQQAPQQAWLQAVVQVSYPSGLGHPPGTAGNIMGISLEYIDINGRNHGDIHGINTD